MVRLTTRLFSLHFDYQNISKRKNAYEGVPKAALKGVLGVPLSINLSKYYEFFQVELIHKICNKLMNYFYPTFKVVTENHTRANLWIFVCMWWRIHSCSS